MDTESPSIRARLTAQLRGWLAQGRSPQQLSWALALGAVIGTMPLLGATTLLCAAVAAIARINQPLIQAVNYAVYPLQLLLLLPFWRAGEQLLGLDPVPLLHVGDVVARFESGATAFFIEYSRVAAAGILAWLLAGIPATGLILWGSRPLLRRLLERSVAPAAGAGG